MTVTEEELAAWEVLRRHRRLRALRDGHNRPGDLSEWVRDCVLELLDIEIHRSTEELAGGPDD